MANLLELRLPPVQILQLHVALRVGFHVRQRSADGERADARRAADKVGQRLAQRMESAVASRGRGQWSEREKRLDVRGHLV